MRDETGWIEEIRALGGDFFLLKTRAPEISQTACPGQFVMIQVSPTVVPLLRRPLGILRVKPPLLWLFFQVVGQGSAVLAGRRPGDALQILGPLGKGFPDFRDKNVLLMAGGRGIVPLFFAAEKLRECNRVFLAYGGRQVSVLHMLDEIAELKLQNVFLYTEDGSCGKRGLVSDETESLIAENSIDTLCACGPDAMLRTLASRLRPLPIAAYFSFEALMACGFGICHSCSLKGADGKYLKMCSDGPVFRLEDVAWPI